MRYLNGVLLLLSTATTVTAQLKKCAADNCLRAIRASGFPTRSGTLDCSSYFQTVITPTTSISLVVVTPTTTRTVAGDVTTVAVAAIEAVETPKTFTPSVIPDYASPCSGSVRYSSACSCIAVTPQIIAATITPTTVFTLTNTILQPTTSNPTATATSVKFLIQLQNGFPSAYLRAVPWEVNPAFVLVLPTSDPQEATVFYLDPYGKLTSNEGVPRTGLGDSGVDGDYISFNDPDGRYPFFLYCAINDFKVLSCRGGPYEEFKIKTSPTGLYITPKGSLSNPLVMKAVPPPTS